MVLEVMQSIYDFVINTLPGQYKVIPKLFFLAVAIALYAIFVWVFYRFLARRDILKLNLKKYNIFEMAWLIKIFAVLFYILEFVILIPIVITIWYAGLGFLLLVLLQTQQVETVLMIAAGIVGAIRITSYFTEDLSKDLAKLFPFTLLSVALLTPGFFSSDIVARFAGIPTLFSTLIYYALFIAAIEIVFRIFYIAYRTVTSGGESYGLYEEEEKKEKE